MQEEVVSEELKCVGDIWKFSWTDSIGRFRQHGERLS